MSFRTIYRSLERHPSADAVGRIGADWRFTAARRCPDCFNSPVSLRGTFVVSRKNIPIMAGSATRFQAIMGRTA